MRNVLENYRIFQESLIHVLIFHHVVHDMLYCALLQFVYKLFSPKNVNFFSCKKLKCLNVKEHFF